MIFYALFRSAVIAEAEAVREYLIHYTAAKPSRGVKALLVHRQPKAAPLPAHQTSDVAGTVGAEPVAAHGGLYTEAIPQGLGCLRHCEAGGIAVAQLAHGVAPLHIVSVYDEIRFLYSASQKPEGQAQLRAALHRSVRAAVHGHTAVMGYGQYRGRSVAQHADDVGGAWLEGVHILQVYAAGAQIITAAGYGVVGVVQGKAAVVHKQARQLRSHQGISPGIEALPQPVRAQSHEQALMYGGVAGGRGLEILLYQALRRRALQTLAQLFIAAHRHPAAFPVFRLHGTAVAVADSHAAALRPVLAVAAAEIDFISP